MTCSEGFVVTPFWLRYVKVLSGHESNDKVRKGNTNTQFIFKGSKIHCSLMILYYWYTLIILSICSLSLWEIHCHWAPNVSHHPQAPKITSGLEALLIQKKRCCTPCCWYLFTTNCADSSASIVYNLCLRHKRLHSFPVITLQVYFSRQLYRCLNVIRPYSETFAV